jgi:hypothetical protein
MIGMQLKLTKKTIHGTLTPLGSIFFETSLAALPPCILFAEDRRRSGRACPDRATASYDANSIHSHVFRPRASGTMGCLAFDKQN